jgi:cellobiose transport system permease protein
MATTTISSLKRTKNQELWHEIRRSFWPYLFISPFFILYAIFGLFPNIFALVLSFKEWDGLSEQRWVGLQNYIRLFQDAIWWKAVFNTIWLMIGSLIPQLSLAFLLAFILNSGYIRFKDAFRTAFFTPVIASSVAMAIVFGALFGTRFGILNYLLSYIGIPPIDWLGSAAWIKPAIALLVIWRWTGYNTIIYLAGLQSIPTDLYEAARVDGAKQRDIFWHITLPLMRPVITFTVILSIIGSLQLFEEPLLLTAGSAGGSSTSPGGTDQAGLTTMMYIFNASFQYVKFGYGSAMSFALFVLIFGFSFFYNRFLGRNLTD